MCAERAAAFVCKNISLSSSRGGGNVDVLR
jgi:hypothetical protein